MKERVKVVEFVTRLEFGGVEAMLMNYISHFHNPRQFDIHIITQDVNDADCISQFEKMGCKVHIVTHKRKSIPRNVVEIFRIMKHEKFDVAHSHMTLTNFYVLFIAKILGVPMRISHAHSAFNDNGLKAKLTYPVLKYLNKLLANVWMTCGYEAGTFLYGEKSIQSGKVHVMNNAIDLKRFIWNQESREKIRMELGLDKEFCLGHIGRFMTPKNHPFVVRIFSELLKISPNAKLLLVGDGELKSQIQNLVDEMKLGDNVIFVGNVKDTSKYYLAMDTFILPSLYEGLPVVTIEAQAVGIPSIVSDKVDRRCGITSDIHFMSIENNAGDWAKSALNLGRANHHENASKELTEAGYNIEVESKRLEKLYITGEY